VNGPDVHAIALQPDGRVIVGGDFTTMDGQPRGRIARLLPNGSVDPSFVPGSGFSHDVYALALDAGGSVLVGGRFTVFDGYVTPRLTRLLPNGSLDLSYDVHAGPLGDVYFHSTAIGWPRPDRRLAHAV
jgi:hypothetical protein